MSNTMPGKFLYVTWPDAIALSLKLASIIEQDNYRPNAIVAISRGGLVPARIISDALNIEEVYSIKASLWGIFGKKYKDVQIKDTYLPIKGKEKVVV